MGLAERRAAKEFETKRFPALKQQIEEAAKFAVSVQVSWDKLAEPDRAHLYDECWPPVYFAPLIAALGSITRDDMGRDALKEKLTGIVITNETENCYASGLATFSGGVLKLDHQAACNVDDVAARTEAITKLLESHL